MDKDIQLQIGDKVIIEAEVTCGYDENEDACLVTLFHSGEDVWVHPADIVHVLPEVMEEPPVGSLVQFKNSSDWKFCRNSYGWRDIQLGWMLSWDRILETSRSRGGIEILYKPK